MNKFTENEKDYPEKVIKKKMKRKKYQIRQMLRKVRLLSIMITKKKYLCIIVLFFICLTVNVLLFR